MFDGHQAVGDTARREHGLRQPNRRVARTGRGGEARRAAGGAARPVRRAQPAGAEGRRRGDQCRRRHA